MLPSRYSLTGNAKCFGKVYRLAIMLENFDKNWVTVPFHGGQYNYLNFVNNPLDSFMGSAIFTLPTTGNNDLGV
jgi:hypothetical protein